MTEVLTYEALKAKCDRLEQINAQTLQVKLTMAETIKELTDRVNALAVESQALKDAITTHSQSTHFCELCGKDDPCSTDDVCYALNETPSTDAALAAIRNEATARALKNLCDCQLISATVAELKADELREAK